MRRVLALLIPLVALVAACGDTAADGGAGAGDRSQAVAAFEDRAIEVLESWRAGPAATWHDGFVPLQDLTLPPDPAGAPEDAKMALLAGWYRAAVAMPDAAAGPGTIRFAGGGTLNVPLVTAAEAFRAIDQGDSSCPGGGEMPSPRVAPKIQTERPDTPVSSSPGPCAELTVTAVRLGTAPLHTSRGEATVPAWLFTVAELPEPVARVAVAPSAIPAPPSASPPAPPQFDGLVPAEDLVSVDGAKVTYRLGVGACDENITPLVYEADDAVVVAGSVTRSARVCTEQLLLHPVTVALDRPLGDRPVLDALNGQPLTITRR
jgi:hypothetical protein